MRILILNPPAEHTLSEYPDSDGETFIETEDFGYFPPLGALYVLSYLEKHSVGHDLFFKDCVAEKISHAQLSGVIHAINPDIVGITSFTISLIDVCRAAKTVRTAVPLAHICMGGHHPIAFPFQAAVLDEFDSIVVGEGELAFTDLVAALEKGRDIDNIPGVYTKTSITSWSARNYHDRRFLGSLSVQPAYVEDIDTLPMPNRNFIRHIQYRSVVGVTGNLATLISSRGCPYQCTFCDVPYKKYRRRSVDKVLDEVAACLAMDYREFHFYDDLFNITTERVTEFCGEIRHRGLQFPWSFRGRVNTVTEESIKLLKRSGCRLISFGVETGSDSGLRQLKKNTTLTQIRNVFRWCRKHGVKTLADFMIGLPFEKTEADIQRNIDFLVALDPDYAQISILSLYPNTTLFQDAVETGLIEDGKWEAFALNPTPDFSVDHWNEFFASNELVAFQKKAYRQYYLRPTYVLRSVFNTRTLYEFKTKAAGLLKLLF